MKAQIIAIGHSRGIRIPKPLLEQTGLEGEVDIRAANGALIIAPRRKARAGWAKAFAELAKRGDDQLLDDLSPSQTSWDEENWEWQ